MEKKDNTAKNKKGIRLVFTKKTIIVLLVLTVMAYLGVLIVLKSYSIVEYEKQRTLLENQLLEKEQEIKELEEMIKNAEDPKFIEKVARENLKMVKPNETVYIVNK